MAITKVTSSVLDVDIPAFKTFGTSSIMIGDTTTGTIDAANNNTGVGVDVFAALTSGDENVAVGTASLAANTTGSFLTAVGYQSLSGNTTANNNTGLGHKALFTTTTGADNTAVGKDSLRLTTTGANNTAVGKDSLRANTTASNNTAVGYQALDAATTGHSNSMLGKGAGGAITTGINNVCIGADSGLYNQSITTASNVVCLGPGCHPSSGTTSNQIVIATDGMTGQAGGHVTIGSTGGKIYNNFTSNATWTQTSDERLKKDIQDDSLGLNFVNRLRPVTFKWKAKAEIEDQTLVNPQQQEKDLETVIHGLIAQEVKQAMDDEGTSTFNGWNSGSNDTLQGVSREMFITPLIKAVQELSAKNDALEARLTALES